MNSRFEAFLHTSQGKSWKDNRQRNAAYINFIAEMKVRYLGDFYSHITNDTEFTEFIWQQVKNESQQVA